MAALILGNPHISLYPSVCPIGALKTCTLGATLYTGTVLARGYIGVLLG